MHPLLFQIRKTLTSKFGQLCMPLILGIANVVAFAPLHLWPLQLVSLSGLFFLIRRAPTVKSVFLTTWLYCFAWLFAGVSWLTVTMFRYGDMPVWLSIVAVALFAALLACLPALYLCVAARYKPYFSSAAFFLVLLPAAWSLAEWTRGWIFTGFPWVVSGYVHNVSPLAGFAPILGVYGISWLGAMIAGSIVLTFNGQRRFSIVAIALFVIGALFQMLSWTTPHGEPLNVRLLQGNIDQNLKFRREHIITSLQYYQDAILEKPADLIITPETALPLPSYALPPGYLSTLQRYAKESKSALALGIFESNGPGLYTNSMLGISPNLTEPVYRYDKYHLVPFGEFIPKGFNWFYHYMDIPMGDLQRGEFYAAPFAVKDQAILPNICYEDVFGEEIAAKIRHAYFTDTAVPTILLNITNLSWFGDTWALPQHVQIAQMRTLETGRPMLRSTNTGVTALIDAEGHIVKQLAPFKRDELEVSVQGYQGITPYIVGGNYVWLGLLGVMILSIAIRRRYVNPR